MKVLICGSSGLVGYDISHHLTLHNIEWVGTYNTRPVPNSYKVNLASILDLSTFIDTIQPDVCINCVVERNVNLCETQWEQVKSTNIDIVNNISKVCSERNIYIVHISTDYVFDGKMPPYYPTSHRNPIQNYGISKFISEQRVLSYTNYCSIIRVPVLYTNTIKNYSETAVTQIGKKVLDCLSTVEEDNYYIRRPVFIPDLCNYILDCINAKKCGIFHFYNPFNKLTKYKILELIAKYLNKSISHVKAIDTEMQTNDQAGRPYDTQLLDVSYDNNTYTNTKIEDGIELCFSKLYHPTIDLQVAPSESLFFCIDLDGTLIDTDMLHFNCYKKALEMHNHILDLNTYKQLISIDEYILKYFDTATYKQIKTSKNTLLHESEEVNSIKGATDLLTYINKYNINHVVVTNTSHSNVEFFKLHCPMLQLVKNWITREDYVVSKPDPECYRLAKELYYKDEKYIIGIENSVVGYSSICNITKCIYIITEFNSYTHNKLKSQDCYFVPDITSLYTNVPKYIA